MLVQPTLSVHSSLDGLPADAQRIFEAGRRRDFALGAEWFRNLIGNGMARGAQARFSVLSRGSSALAVVPLQLDNSGRLGSLTNWYTCLYMPLIADDAPPRETARLLGRELARLCADKPVVRLDALPLEWPEIEAFLAGINDGGLLVRRFANFGNWHEPLAGRSWQAYCLARPGSLRELLRRKAKHAFRAGQIEFEIIRETGDLPRGIAAYETVYGRSWKPPEPHPRFNPGLMQEAARVGALRLAIAWRHGEPIAAQLWIVANRCATVMKLAHDKEHAALSAGTLLTARTVEELMREEIEAIDLGRGDDPYKRLWASERRQRIGILFLNPRRLRGLMALARHDGGVALRPLRARAAAECELT